MEEQQSNNSMHEQELPELVFGLIGPCGTDLKLVSQTLASELRRMAYHVEEITLSELIQSAIPALKDRELEARDDNEYARISRLMKAGTAIRKKANHGDAVARLAVAAIRNVRPLDEAKGEPRYAGNAFILKSLKHPKEIQFLRRTYGSGCFMISAYSPREERVSALAERLEKSEHLPPGRSATALAEDLIAMDESELGEDLGQDVKDAFPMADMFLDARARQSMEKNLRRFVEIIFRHPYHTPSPDEYGMFHAKSESPRVLRRLQSLRKWSHYEQAEQVFPRGP